MMGRPASCSKSGVHKELIGKKERKMRCVVIKKKCFKHSYRNKCEFTVGMNEETELPTVGFRIGSYVNGTTGVGPIDELVHIPFAMTNAAKVFRTISNKFEYSFVFVDFREIRSRIRFAGF